MNSITYKKEGDKLNTLEKRTYHKFEYIRFYLQSYRSFFETSLGSTSIYIRGG